MKTKLSTGLSQLIDEWVSGFISWTGLSKRIIEKAKADHVDLMVVREIMETRLRERGLSDRTIRAKLPKELRIHNYPKSRKTTDWQKSANPKTETKIKPEDYSIETLDYNQALVQMLHQATLLTKLVVQATQKGHKKGLPIKTIDKDIGTQFKSAELLDNLNTDYCIPGYLHWPDILD